MCTAYHAKYFAYELTERCASDSMEKLAASLADAQVDLNPHQVEAALFAFRSPYRKGLFLPTKLGWARPSKRVSLRRCLECNALVSKGRTKFCSTQCATRARVRRHRLKHNEEGSAHVKIRRQQQARKIEREQIDARKRLREAATNP
jgi:Fe-S-cluster-containing dehydrogenase component